MSNYLTQRLIKNWKEKVTPKLSPLLSVLWLGGIALAVLAMWVFAEISEEILDKETQFIDTIVLKILYALHTPLLNKIMTGITTLGNPPLLIAISVIFGLVLLAKTRKLEAISLLITTFGGLGLNYFLKNLFARTRPLLWDRIVDISSYSFPSGHAMLSMIVYGFIGYWLAINYPRWQSLTISLTIILIGAIGFSRLYLGVHWPTDVIAGYSGGFVWLIMCVFSLEVITKIRSQRQTKLKSE